MSVLPNGIVDRIEFCERHLTTWQANALLIGTTAAAVTDLGTKTTATRAALQAQGEHKDAAKSATKVLHSAEDAMVDAVADILKQIKTQAAITGDGVYALADIDGPALPSPRPAPGKPLGLKASLVGDTGELSLKWKCPNPAGANGTIYQLWRRNSPTGEFEYIGTTGKRSFVDSTLPAGATHVTYQIQAIRSTITGPVAEFNVNFGVGASGAISASVSPRIAA